MKVNDVVSQCLRLSVLATLVVFAPAWAQPADSAPESPVPDEKVAQPMSGKAGSQVNPNASAAPVEAKLVEEMLVQEKSAEENLAEEKPAEVSRFDILEFNVLGNHVLSQMAIEKAVYPFLGESKTIDDAEAARQALEKAYHSAGYLTVLVNIPEQKVDSGVVNLEVVEGKVDRLRITGSRYYSLGQIRASVPQLAEGNTPHFPTLQKELESLNRQADRAVTPVMKAGQTPGTVTMELKVKDSLPLHATVGLNNYYNADTTPLRSVVNLRYDNLWQLGHSVNFTWLTAPEKPSESQVYSLTYAVPFASGRSVAAYIVHTDSDVAAVGTTNVLGSGDIYGLRYIVPLPEANDSKNFFHSLTTGVDYKDFGQTINLAANRSGINALNFPITYMPFVATYAGGYRGASSFTGFDVSANAHVRGLVADDNDFNDKRFQARANYAFLRANVFHSANFYLGSKLNIRLSGQLTDQPLISNEQFAIGGIDSVRGYLQSEAIGDVGYIGNLELHTGQFGHSISGKVKDLHMLGFFDFGQANIVQALPSQVEDFSFASYGVGVRLGVAGFKTQLDFAVPLNDGLVNRTKAGDLKVHFNMEYAF